MASTIKIVRNVAKIPGRISFGSGAYTDLVSSSDTAEKPIVAGVWNLQDTTSMTESWEAEWDEVKYVVSGSVTIKDHHTGEEHTANTGDYIWFPTGAKTSIIKSTNLTTIYVEQRHADWGVESSKLDNWLASRLNELITWFTESNPKSAQDANEAALVLPGGNTRTVLYQVPFPLVHQSGQGAYITSKDNVEYLDFVSEYSAALYGHSHPKIQEAVQEALRAGFHLGSVIGKEGELGRLIQKRFPSMELMRFANSGTEANTLALAAALANTGKKEVLVFNNGYHGSTLSFAGGKNPPMNLPHQFLMGKYNDIEATKRLLHHGIGAILVEPLQSAGGNISATHEFLQFLRDSATLLDAVLIFDEVVTSRLHFYGLQGYHGIIPDMTTLGKYIGGGFSFGCFGGQRSIMKQFDPSTPGHLTHSGTFNNNVFTMTAGIAGMKLATANEIARINAQGDRMRDGINKLAQENGLGDHIQATGFGSAVGIHFHGQTADGLRDLFYFEMLKRRIIVGRRGFVSLNLMHEDAHTSEFLQATADILTSVSKQLASS